MHNPDNLVVAERHPRPAATRADGPSVLLVECDRGLIEMVEYALAARGVGTVVEGDVRAALDLLRRGDPDGTRMSAVLNVDLPGMGGVDVLDRLGPETVAAWQLVLLTRTRSERDHARALEGGALDYFVKPVSLPVLVARIVGRLPRHST